MPDAKKQSTTSRIKSSLLVLLLLFFIPSEAFALNPLSWCWRAFQIFAKSQPTETTAPPTDTAQSTPNTKGDQNSRLEQALLSDGIEPYWLQETFRTHGGFSTVHLSAFEYARYIFSKSSEPTVYVKIGVDFSTKQAWRQIQEKLCPNCSEFDSNQSIRNQPFNLLIEVLPEAIPIPNEPLTEAQSFGAWLKAARQVNRNLKVVVYAPSPQKMNSSGLNELLIVTPNVSPNQGHF